LDESAATKAGMKGIVVHGVLCMGLLSAAIGSKVGRIFQRYPSFVKYQH
jgi:acyl dehydratase